MKKLFIAVIPILLSISLSAQSVVPLDESTPFAQNGLEYGYYISNESSKEVKGEDYDRYEVNLYVTNKGNCLKLIPFKPGMVYGVSNNYDSDEVQVAEFNCTNANGKRLTAKKGNVSAKPYYAYVKIPDELAREKYRLVNAQVGYAIRNGQTITNKIIVIVPKGERPKINCRVIYIPEFQ